MLARHKRSPLRVLHSGAARAVLLMGIAAMLLIGAGIGGWLWWKDRQTITARVPTVAGELVMRFHPDPEGFLGTSILTLAGREVLRKSDTTLDTVVQSFPLGGGTALAMSGGSDGGNSCDPPPYVLFVSKDSVLSRSSPIGECQPLRSVRAGEQDLVFVLRSIDGGDEEWRYTGGRVIPPAPPPKPAVAAKLLEFKEDVPFKLSGKLVAEGGSDPARLVLPEPVAIPDFCGGYTATELPVHTNDPLPTLTEEQEFLVTIGCPRAGAMIVDLWHAPTAARLLRQQWHCQGEFSDKVNFADGNRIEWVLQDFPGPGRTQQRLGIYALRGRGVDIEIQLIPEMRSIGRSPAVRLRERLDIQRLSADTLEAVWWQASSPTEKTAMLCKTDPAALPPKPKAAPPVKPTPPAEPPPPAPAQSQRAPTGDLPMRYAEEIGRQLRAAGHPACAMFAQNIEMVARTGAPDYVRIRQIDAMVNKVPSVCLR